MKTCGNRWRGRKLVALQTIGGIMTLTPEMINQRDTNNLPGLMGMKVLELAPKHAKLSLEVRPDLLAINGFLHGGTVVSLADTAAGYGCMATLPESAEAFTTIELKCNMMGTAREGTVSCVATCLHAGRTTQVWESVVTSDTTDKVIAKFTCTQMVLYPR